MVSVTPPFDTIVLLTGPAEQVALAPLLQRCNPALRVVPVVTRGALKAIDRSTLRRARLIAFVSADVVPPDILRAVGHGAFNFHPGPPDYPGWAPAHFALYERATQFGVTFHVMADRVDTGPIIETDLFPLLPDISVLMLEEIAYTCLVQLFRRWAPALANKPELPRMGNARRWADKRNSRRNYQALCDIPLDIGKDDLVRRMTAFGGNHFGIAPTIRLHGFEFQAVSSASGITEV